MTHFDNVPLGELHLIEPQSHRTIITINRLIVDWIVRFYYLIKTMKLIHFVLSLLLVAGWLGLSDGLLYPRDTETRLVHSLNGIWSFRLSPTWDQEAGFRDEWFSRPLVDSGPVISMPVPASYNDVTQNK